MGIIIVDLVAMLLYATLFGVSLVQLLTTFTDEGARRPSIFGATFIRWSETTEVTGYSPDMIVLELRSAKKRIRINKLYFKDKNELISLVRKHVPSLVRLDANVDPHIRRRTP